MICGKCKQEKDSALFSASQLNRNKNRHGKPLCKTCVSESLSSTRKKLQARIDAGETVLCRKCQIPLSVNNYYSNTNRCSDCCKKDVATIRKMRINADKLRIPRQCCACKKMKQGTGIDGFVAGQPRCKACNRELQLENRAKKYGLTKDQVLALFGETPTCGICKKTINKSKAIHIDHCHKTGNVRGILCNTCNVGIGFLKENIQVLQSAITYLNGNDQKHVTEKI
jgi:hypothetical protein